MKIGVGTLLKNGPKYASYNHCYEVFKLAKTQVKWGRSSAHFTQVCEPVNGYGYTLEAWLTLDADTIRVRHRLANTGTRSFFTLNYVHNFLQFADDPSVKGYTVTFPYDFEANIAKSSVITQEGRQLTFIAEITPKMKGTSAIIDSFPKDRTEESVRVKRPDLGMLMCINVSEPAWKVTIHGSVDSLSPEQFIRVDLAPGESKEWERTYQFEVDSEASQ
jgi:hypothetical protein